MKCPECAADTVVIDTRPTDGNRQWRRRVCTGDSRHRTSTTEITLAEHKALLSDRAVLEQMREKRRASWRSWITRKRSDTEFRTVEYRRAQARAEAAETGEPVDAIYARWGVS